MFTLAEKHYINSILKIINSKNKNEDIKMFFDEFNPLCCKLGRYLVEDILFVFYLGPNSKKIEGLDDVIKIMLSDFTQDINLLYDINKDTVLHIAAMSKNTEWLVEWLLDNFENLDVNLVNDIGYTAFGNAIRNKNENIAKIIARRKDLRPTESDLNAIERLGYNKEMFGLV